ILFTPSFNFLISLSSTYPRAFLHSLTELTSSSILMLRGGGQFGVPIFVNKSTGISCHPKGESHTQTAQVTS
ncbi:MAG: hypothetical protein ACXVLQ_14525, partial [Bacteriovorax sp.]